MTSTPTTVHCDGNCTDPTRHFLKLVERVVRELSSLRIELVKVRGLVAMKRLYILPGTTPLGGKERDLIVQLALGLAEVRAKLLEILSNSSC